MLAIETYHQMAGIKIPLVFYRTEAGTEPARECLKQLPEDDRREIGQDLMRLQWRWPIGMPLCRSLGNGLWEVRCSLPGHRTARVILCAHDGELVALHGFIKKSQKTPKADMDLAGKRKKEMEDND
jgi:phage-related protein